MKLAEGYTGGRIEVIDQHTGKVRCLYDRCGEHRLCAPNDLVFDASGGFWFTDSGKQHPRHRDYGALYWIDGRAPSLADAFPRYSRLVTALDTGGAIRGQVRADLYIGSGDAAGREAGRVKHQLHMWRLIPAPAQP